MPMKEASEARPIQTSSSCVKILKGIVIAIILTFILVFIFALVLTYTNIGEETITPVIIGVTGISILVR